MGCARFIISCHAEISRGAYSYFDVEWRICVVNPHVATCPPKERKKERKDKEKRKKIVIF